MKPTDILKQEHRVIEQVLDCLEAIAAAAEKARRLDAADARDAIDFLRTFADACHHGKEETHLFPAMELKGFSREMGPTGVMLYEHDQGRAHVRAMSEAIDAAAAGDASALATFVGRARQYIALLREHIEKEDHCLFTMADQAFSEADQAKLLAIFDRVETEHMGAGTHERYVALANRLAKRYNVTPAPTAAGCGGCCGG